MDPDDEASDEESESDDRRHRMVLIRGWDAHTARVPFFEERRLMPRQHRARIPDVAINQEYPGGPLVPPVLQPLWIAARQARSYNEYMEALARWQTGVEQYAKGAFPLGGGAYNWVPRHLLGTPPMPPFLE